MRSLSCTTIAWRGQCIDHSRARMQRQVACQTATNTSVHKCLACLAASASVLQKAVCFVVCIQHACQDIDSYCSSSHTTAASPHTRAFCNSTWAKDEHTKRVRCCSMTCSRTHVRNTKPTMLQCSLCGSATGVSEHLSILCLWLACHHAMLPVPHVTKALVYSKQLQQPLQSTSC
jgi:hypothetical protein